MKKSNSIYIIFLISIIVALLAAFSIILIDPYVSNVDLVADKGASWYYWKLPERDKNIMLIVWLLFLMHITGNIILIIKRLEMKTRSFTKINLQLLIFNFVFIILHYLKSILIYDGLAQDVPVFSSQYSVILILVLTILMLIPKRGIFLGKKIKINPQELKLLYKVHGFLFTFSIIYTFWYHPAINTIGHITGFIYIYLLIIQVSFVKTKVHYNLKWILLLEVLVAFHGTAVAYYVQNSTLWSMFLFGFLFIFFFTQIYSLKINKYIRLTMQVLFIVCAISYYLITDINSIHQILWIPVIEYANVLVFIAVIKSIFIIKNKISNSKKV